MGGQNEKPKPPPPTMEEVIIDMKMAAKKFERDSKKAEKEKNQQITKARQAIQKGNEEGARMYLANAATKQREAQNMLRMGHKMDALVVQIKSNTSSTTMMEQLNKITPILYSQAQNVPVEKLYNDMQVFEQSMDEILVSGKVMDQVLNQNMGMDANQDQAVDNMFYQLKQEQINEIGNDLQNNTGLFNELQNPNQMQMNQNNNQVQMNDQRK